MKSPDRSIELHIAAVEQLELAARYNREAAKHYEQGEPVKVRHHAHIARGHFLNAQAHVHDAAKVHAAGFSSQIRNDPSH